MDDENKLLNFEYNPDKIYEATKKYIEFKQLLKTNYKGKAYLIENNIFEYLSSQYNNAKPGSDMKNELKKEDIKNKIISEKIKIIENVEDIESNSLEIITQDILISLGIDKKYCLDKEVNLKVLSDTIQQIIFKDKSKLNISFYDNKKNLNIIESPIDYKESNEDKKDKKTESFTNIKQSKNSIYLIPEKNNKNHLSEKKGNKPLVNGNEIINININSNKNNNEITCQKNGNKIKINLDTKETNNIENVNIINEISENYKLFDCQSNFSYHDNLESNSNGKNSFCLFTKNSTLPTNKDSVKQNFYDNIKELYEQQKSINNLMDEIINLKNEFNNYLIINKNWFNRLVKIFENQEIYQNELKFIDSFEKITNISNSKINDQIFKRRRNELTEESLFKLELENERSLQLRYPKEFILIEKESLNKFNFNFTFNINNNAYKILFGEKHLFIKDKENSKNIFVCSRDKFFFSVNLILNYNKEEYFKQEIEKFIQNKGGIEHYIKEKNYDIMSVSPQNNMNINGDSFGFVLILLNKKGKGKEKEKRISNKDNNVDDEKPDQILKISIIEINPKNTSIDNSRSLKINYNPYIYSFLLSLKKIEILKEIFVKSISQNQNNDIFNLLYKFLNTNDLAIINELYKKIYEINSNFKMNFKNLIGFLLALLHKEFNSNNNYLDKNNPEGDFDEKLSYKIFKKNFFESNDSFIQRTFFGVKEIMITYKCCGLTKYFYESFEYIYIDSELLKKSFNLNDLISNWGNKTTNEIHKCLTCNYNTHCFVAQKIIDYPQFLIIVLDNDENRNNKNNYKIRFDNKVITEKFEYNLLNCISNSLFENKNYNVITNEENKWYIFNNDNNKKEIEKDKIEYPEVFILQKGLENKKSNEAFNSHESYNIADYLSDSSNNDDKGNNKYKNNFKKPIINVNDINDLVSMNKSLSRTDTEVMINVGLFNDNLISEKKNEQKSVNNQDIKNNQNNIIMPKIDYNQNQNSNQNNYNMNNNNVNKSNNNVNNNNMKNNGNNNNQMNIYYNNDMNKNNQKISNNQVNNYNNNMYNNYNNNMYNNNFMNNMNYNQMNNVSNSQMNNINNNNINNINLNNINYINNNNMYNNNNYMNSNKSMNNNNDHTNNYQINNMNNNMKLNENNGQITIYFKLHNGKEIYLDTNENYYFGDVIQQLFRQNDWLQKEIKIIDFVFNEKSVRLNHTLNQIGIKHKSIIKILHKNLN